MIQRHNLKQLLWVPVHLTLGSLGYAVCWWFFTSTGETLWDRFEFLLPHAVMKNRGTAISAITSLAILAATYEGWKLWSEDRTELPGLLSGVVPQSAWGPGAGLGRIEMTTLAVELRLLLNLVLSGPIQMLSAWRRLLSTIPDTTENRSRINRWSHFADAQSGWHAEDLYSEDETALEWLIRMRYLDYSPTKGLVKVSETRTIRKVGR